MYMYMHVRTCTYMVIAGAKLIIQHNQTVATASQYNNLNCGAHTYYEEKTLTHETIHASNLPLQPWSYLALVECSVYQLVKDGSFAPRYAPGVHKNKTLNAKFKALISAL